MDDNWQGRASEREEKNEFIIHGFQVLSEFWFNQNE